MYSSFKTSDLFFLSGFECGFSPMLSSVSNFSVSIMRLLIFFIILDVEVVLLLNCFGAGESGLVSFFCFEESLTLYYLVFVLVVLVGFFYEVGCGLVNFS
nr:NADH dehydrogenase subunit 3 [Eudiplozoon nipponicum]WET59158.1 NADH dehydrogenase subunit 3 [Eudiplozoon nipponicum]WET59170.1 NADH dehydrogenase subunit 3 [Eudiplozoon nipponicum]WET59182.1 NADH dehydrogenase subunit 3 [Eudiplozoon nipponicum]